MNRENQFFWRLVLLSWLAFALMGAAGSIATPIGASPDEPAHLIRAASVATGQIAPFATNHGKVRVPQYIFDSQKVSCFALDGNDTPNCVRPTARAADAVATVYASSGRYNPLYYAIVGWPSLIFHSSVGIYAMRIVSDLVVTLFLAISFGFIAGWKRPLIPLLGLSVAVTPMVLFLGGMVNPNSLEITATLATFVGVLTVIRQPDRELLGRRAASVFVAASVAANMRGLSLVWIAVAILAPFIFASRVQIVELLRAQPVRLTMVGCVLSFAAAIVWMLYSNPLGVGDPGATGTLSPQGLGTSHLFGFLWTFFSTFYYGQQMVGQFGWLETPSPLAVYFVWSTLLGGLAILTFAVVRRRALVFAIILIGAVLLLPAIVQGIYVTSGGVIWQGRYILPLFVCAVVGLATVVSDRLALTERTTASLFVIVLGAWAVAQVLAFATTLKRYVVGMAPQWPAVLHPAWSPPGGVLPSIVIFGLIVVVSAVSVVGWEHRVRALGVGAPPEPDAVKHEAHKRTDK